MANEVINSAAEAAAPEVSAEPTKKTRAPRRSKAEIAAEKAASAHTAKGSRRKRGEAAADKTSIAETPVSGKRGRKITVKSTPKAASQSGRAAREITAPTDEFADLVQLEEENRQLRTALADKLRAENADLRKRLGV